jgi:hypothetical protein
MNKKEKLAFAFVVALAMTSGGFAFGQSVNNVSSDQVIYACVTGVNGNITKVSNTPKTCPKGTTPISWNMVGPQGVQGMPGTAGMKGDKGETGAQGLAGASGAGVGQSDAYLVDPAGIEHPIVNFGGSVPLVKVNDTYWGFSNWGGFRPSDVIFYHYPPVELYKKPNCQGDLFGVDHLVSTPKNMAALSPLGAYSDKVPEGYSASVSENQNFDGFLSYKWLKESEDVSENGDPVRSFICENKGADDIAKSLSQKISENDGHKMGKAYIYKLTLIGDAPSFGWDKGWTFNLR